MFGTSLAFTMYPKVHTSAMDVVNYLITLASKEDGQRNLDAITIQKLLFYAQCWSLADGCRLFDEDVEAWTNGPVVRSVWRVYNGRSTINAEQSELEYELTGDQMDLIKGVWESYKAFNGFALRDRTHRAGGAWRQTRGSLPDSTASNKTISPQRMAQEAQTERSEASDWLTQNWDMLARTTSHE